MDTREFQTIKVEVDGALGRLTLNRPDRLNAIGATMLLELAEAARWFDTHRELRVVIMSGAGRAFCSGADLRDPPQPTCDPAATRAGSIAARQARTACALPMRSSRCAP
jgi:enoyl-CoA hydratase/carnithine racemase